MNHQRTPNFYCIGAQKAGTTTLHEILKNHPNIYLPECKEAHFFHKDQLFKKGFDWYLQKHFSNVQDEKIIGSFTPEYLYFEESAKRIYNTLGKEIKFLVLLRNPAERAFSHYKMSKFRGFETLQFEEAINKENKRIKESLFNKIHFSYINRGFYYKQISRYLEYFSLDNFLFINFENELIKTPDKTLRKISNFLDVEHVDLNTGIRANTSKLPIFPKVNRALGNKPYFIQKISNLLPHSVKRTARSFIEDKNSTSQTPGLDQRLKSELMLKVYFSDIKKLENELFYSNQWMDSLK